MNDQYIAIGFHQSDVPEVITSSVDYQFVIEESKRWLSSTGDAISVVISRVVGRVTRQIEFKFEQR